MQWNIPLFDPDLGQSEADALADVIRSKWLTMGELTTRFESEFSAFLGCRHGIAVSNGTAALHISHDLAMLSETVDDIAVMYAGEIVERGPVEEIARAPRHPYTAALLDAVTPQ